eukprot:725137-Prymnesium_polylepis.1
MLGQRRARGDAPGGMSGSSGGDVGGDAGGTSAATGLRAPATHARGIWQATPGLRERPPAVGAPAVP